GFVSLPVHASVSGEVTAIGTKVLLLGVAQRSAQGVNMVSFLPAAVIALAIHRKGGRLEVKKSLPAIIAGIAGAVLGSLAAGYIQEGTLKRVFGIFLMVMAAGEIRACLKQNRIDRK
ncbi:MAG: TSUP family transporter, partial [Clostridia bacterium]|nr:TSUP family transporter [Clostridia bacterium]